VVGNIRRSRKHVRAIDLVPPSLSLSLSVCVCVCMYLARALSLSLSVLSSSTPESPTLFVSSSRVPVAFGVPDFSVATERGAPEERNAKGQERERAS